MLMLLTILSFTYYKLVQIKMTKCTSKAYYYLLQFLVFLSAIVITTLTNMHQDNEEK